MTIAAGLFLVAIGAILSFAIRDVIPGIDLYAAGIILMIVGAVAFLISLLRDFVWAERARRTDRVAEQRVDPRYRTAEDPRYR